MKHYQVIGPRGFRYCVHCDGQSFNSLTTHCPGKIISEEDKEKISQSKLDYVSGKWIKK